VQWCVAAHELRTIATLVSVVVPQDACHVGESGHFLTHHARFSPKLDTWGAGVVLADWAEGS
jgi:hypothetical protein